MRLANMRNCENARKRCETVASKDTIRRNPQAAKEAGGAGAEGDEEAYPSKRLSRL